MTTEARAGTATPTFAAKQSSTLRPQVTDVVIEAVLDELAEVGYGKLTMDGVARRARASKPTLYRRWDSKEEMILDALTRGTRNWVPDADDDASLLDHLRLIATDNHRWMSSPRARRINPDILAEAIRNESMAKALTEHIAGPRRDAVRAVLEAARDRGEVREGADLDVALDILGALISWRLSALRVDVGSEYIEEVARIAHAYLTREP